MKKISILLGCVILILSLASCDQPTREQTEEKKDIKIACVETTQDLVNAVIPVMKEKGYNVQYELFDNNVNTMIATNDESVDALVVVHKPFIDNYNQSQGGELTMLEPYIYTVGMGVFSEKYNKIEDLPNNASIAIMNDSMNMNRGLRIFEDAGLLKLANVDKATLLDIEENPKNFNFVEMDQIQTVRSLQDVDAAVVFFSHMKNADKDFNNYLIRDTKPEQFPTGVVVKTKNAVTQWAKDLVEAFRSDPVKSFAIDHYGGLYEYIED